ncbi:MAG: hypothetical protein ACF8TS_06390 [Maioricimonas sp. JB049]
MTILVESESASWLDNAIMGLIHSTCLVAEGFDVANTSKENVRFAYSVDLPFRIRLGAQYQRRFAVRGRVVDVYLRNDVSISREQDLHEFLSRNRSISDLFTRAVVVVANPNFSEKLLHELRAATIKAENLEYPRGTSERFTAQEALNHFVIAYSTATRQLFGGAPLRVLRTYEFSDFLRWEVTIIGPPDALSDDDISHVFELKPEREFVVDGSLTGELFDLPKDAHSHLDDALQRHRDFVFYEYAFEAKEKMVAGDSIGALLMAVAALEGAHGAFVSEALTQRLPDGVDPELPEDFIRALGMSLCNQLTPFLLMDEAQRPSLELVRGAATGLKYRNEVMHALRNRRGEYRTRLRSNAELCEAYSAVLKLYEVYREAFEEIESTSA